METRELIQAAASIAGGIAGMFAERAALTPEVIQRIARESVEIARAIEKASRERPVEPPPRLMQRPAREFRSGPIEEKSKS